MGGGVAQWKSWWLLTIESRVRSSPPPQTSPNLVLRCGGGAKLAGMFDVDELIGECQTAIAEGEAHRAVREVLERTVADAGAVGGAMRPERGGMQILHSAPDLTILHLLSAPELQL